MSLWHEIATSSFPGLLEMEPAARCRPATRYTTGRRGGDNGNWLGDLDSNQDCTVQSREFYR